MSWSRTSLKPKTRINDAETLNGTLNLVSEVDSRAFPLCSLLNKMVNGRVMDVLRRLLNTKET